ncbi:hypothetical protein LP7551_01948 [Roseibium album]|nr:hypothetical protein LP7551_01948 [Roseibium album]
MLLSTAPPPASRCPRFGGWSSFVNDVTRLQRAYSVEKLVGFAI